MMSCNAPINVFVLLRDYTQNPSKQNSGEGEFDNTSFLGTHGIQNLVREAMENTLDELVISLSPEDKENFYELILDRFLKVLEDRETSKDAVSEVAVEMVRLREKCSFTEGKPKKDSTVITAFPMDSPADQEETDVGLPPELNKLLKVYHQGGEPKGNVLHRINTWIQGEREKILQEAQSKQADRIHTLKRRISKLSTLLKETKESFAQMPQYDPQDPGVASEYQAVQGLDSNASDYEEKKAVLREIFNLNKDLKKLEACSVEV
jgi:hypothetical protein